MPPEDPAMNDQPTGICDNLWVPDCLQLPDHLWFPDHLWLNLLILSSSRATAANIHQWVSHTMARASSHDPSFKSLKWPYMVWTLSCNLACRSGLKVPPGLHLGSSSSWAHPCLCQRHSWTEFRISWWTFSSISASQGFLPGNLCSWYTSLNTPCISSLVKLKPMSSTADDSTSRSHSGEGCQQPWQMAQSCSFLQWLQYVKTSCTEGTGSGIHGAPIMDIHPGRHQCQATFLPLVWRCLSLVSAFWLWHFSQFDSHTSNWLRHGN